MKSSKFVMGVDMAKKGDIDHSSYCVMKVNEDSSIEVVAQNTSRDPDYLSKEIQSVSKKYNAEIIKVKS